MKALKLTLSAIVFILATGITISANASTGIESKDKENNTKVTLAHTGDFKNAPVLQLNFDNPAEERVLITIKDESGVVVYNEIYKGKTYAKKFTFEQELADANPVVVVTFLNSNKTETYKVSTVDATYVPTVDITKL